MKNLESGIQIMFSLQFFTSFSIKRITTCPLCVKDGNVKGTFRVHLDKDASVDDLKKAIKSELGTGYIGRTVDITLDIKTGNSTAITADSILNDIDGLQTNNKELSSVTFQLPSTEG